MKDLKQQKAQKMFRDVIGLKSAAGGVKDYARISKFRHDASSSHTHHQSVDSYETTTTKKIQQESMNRLFYDAQRR